jgi:hypothetical protein
MNALTEEAVFHESKRILGWGWFGGRRGFMEEATPRCESRTGSVTWAVGVHVPTFTTSHHAKNKDDPHQESPRWIRGD